MKKLLILTALLPCLVTAQPAPPVEATTNQVAAGTLGYPFVLTPRNLAGSGLGSPTNGQTALQVQTIVDTTSNSIFGFFGTKTNLVVFSGSNGPVVVGQAFVIIGTNATGALVVKGTNWPSGGAGTGTLMPPNALGVLTNNGSGTTNWSSAFPLSWVAGAQTAIDTSSNSVVTNLPYAGKYIAVTNAPTGLQGQVPIATGHLDTNSSPAATWANLPFTGLEFHIATNAFTNNIIGYFTLTNKDGLVFQVLGGTNLP